MNVYKEMLKTVGRSWDTLTFNATQARRTCPPPPHSGYRVSFSEVKWPGRDADHPPPSSARVEYAYIYTYTPTLCLLAM